MAFGMLFVVASSASAQPFGEHMIYRKGSVELWEFRNVLDGGKGYFAKAQPPGPGPFPVLVLVNPYAVFSEDKDWSAEAGRGYRLDRSLPQSARLLKCPITRDDPHGDCKIFVEGPDMSDVAGLGDVFAERARGGESLAAWALAHGSAVVIPFGRFYKGRPALTQIFDVAQTIYMMKTSRMMAPSINPQFVCAAGQSQGGQLVVHAIALLGSALGKNFSINCAVTVGAWVDGREMYHYYNDYLPTVQPEPLRSISQAFSRPYLNRMARSWGPNPDSASWDAITTETVAANWPQVRLLLIAGTDDMMVPVQQSIDLHDALKSTGLVSLKVYEKGPPKFRELHAQAAGHGVLGPDLGAVIRNFITKAMSK
jgi:acetyl esterase/lipase